MLGESETLSLSSVCDHGRGFDDNASFSLIKIKVILMRNLLIFRIIANIMPIINE